MENTAGITAEPGPLPCPVGARVVISALFLFGLNLNNVVVERELLLTELKRGDRAAIATLPDDEALRSQCIRLGLSKGAAVRCLERLPGGTVVLESARQEIALGKVLAQRIGVSRALV